jgi:hypothetical protein
MLRAMQKFSLRPDILGREGGKFSGASLRTALLGRAANGLTAEVRQLPAFAGVTIKKPWPGVGSHPSALAKANSGH